MVQTILQSVFVMGRIKETHEVSLTLLTPSPVGEGAAHLFIAKHYIFQIFLLNKKLSSQ